VTGATMKNEIIISCGGDGGDWTLVGQQGPNGWQFRAVRNEAAIYDLMSDEDRVGFESYEKSAWIEGWEAALALYDKYPWATFFYPVTVHPEFAVQIWTAVQDRFARDERRKHTQEAHDNFHRWLRLCHGGGRASAYSDFLD
jgi:hypothetical protein